MSINDGGPAFPCEQHETQEGTWNQTFESGMSLRDYFAAKVVQSFMRGAVLPPGWDAKDEIQFTAMRAYEVADAMLIAREAIAKAAGDKS
jgi:hypothetical protein